LVQCPNILSADIHPMEYIASHHTRVDCTPKNHHVHSESLSFK
jgi:hypothetical protein